MCVAFLVRLVFGGSSKVARYRITAPSAVGLPELNAVLVKHGLAALDDEEWAPLAA